jgi:hypothetical protein
MIVVQYIDDSDIHTGLIHTEVRVQDVSCVMIFPIILSTNIIETLLAIHLPFVT